MYTSNSISNLYFSGIVTRSKTGISKPKTIDHDSYIAPGSKRGRNMPCTGNSSPAKRVRVEAVNTTMSVSLEEDCADMEEETRSAKKSVRHFVNEFVKGFRMDCKKITVLFLYIDSVFQSVCSFICQLLN